METVSQATSDATCDSSSVQWASLYMSFITVNVFWWCFDIPKIWKHNFKAYLYAVGWQCLRIIYPSVAGAYALVHGHDNHDVAKVFYFGPRTPTERMTKFEFSKVIAADLITLIAAVISIHNACILPANRDGHVDAGRLNVASQVFPAVPGAILGLWFLAVPALKLRKMWMIIVGGFIALAIPCMAAGMTLRYRSRSKDADLWIIPVIFYICISLPLPLVNMLDIRLTLLSGAVSFMARSGTLGIGSLTYPMSTPFCGRKQPAFGILSLVFGIIAVCIAIWAFFMFGGVAALHALWRWRKNLGTQVRNSAIPVSRDTAEDTSAVTRPVENKPDGVAIAVIHEIDRDTSRCNHEAPLRRSCGKPRSPWQQKLHNWYYSPDMVMEHLGYPSAKRMQSRQQTTQSTFEAPADSHVPANVSIHEDGTVDEEAALTRAERTHDATNTKDVERRDRSQSDEIQRHDS